MATSQPCPRLYSPDKELPVAIVGRPILKPNTFLSKDRPNKAEVTGPNGGPIPVMAVVLPVEDMAPQQREVLRSLLLQAKAKERAMSQAQEGDEKV